MRSLLHLRSGLLFAALAVTMTTACKKDDKTPTPGGGGGGANLPPIELDCDYFSEPRVLTDDPDRPVDYLITCKMGVKSDLKIEPGVVIEFEQNAGLVVDAFTGGSRSISAIGTAAKPIVFRGVKKEKGYWRGLFFNSNSPVNELRYVRIEDAGGEAFNSNNNRGGVVVYADGHLKMEHSTISNSKHEGFNAVYQNNTITLNNNTFTGNKYPAHISARNLNILNGTNTCAGNEEDFVMLYAYGSPGTVTSTTTWHKLDVPYKQSRSGHIALSALVTVQPGVHMEFFQESYIKVSESGGGLKAVGTAADPIIFTGISKASKAWKGIYIDSAHPENEIAFAELHHSGFGSPQGNVYLWYNMLLNIHDVKFKNIHGCGVNHRLASGGAMNPNLILGPNITVDAGGCIDGTW